MSVLSGLNFSKFNAILMLLQMYTNGANLQSMVVTESWISDVATTCGISQKEVCCPTRTSNSIKNVQYLHHFCFGYKIIGKCIFSRFSTNRLLDQIYITTTNQIRLRSVSESSRILKKTVVQCSHRLNHNVQFKRVKEGGFA